MTYEVQKGDTIARVTSLMNTDWKALKSINPDAVGRSTKNGNWFLKEGAILKDPASFETRLKEGLAGHQSVLKNNAAFVPVFEPGQGVETGPGPEPEAASENLESSAGEGPDWTTYTIKPGDTLWALAVRKFRVDLAELIETNNIENPRAIQPGQEIRIPPPRTFPKEAEVVASWYGRDYHGRPMANGDFYNMYSDTIAHRELPFGTRVELSNPETGQKATAVVRDRGPFVKGRDIDLSFGLARRLSLVEKGVGTLRMRLLG